MARTQGAKDKRPRKKTASLKIGRKKNTKGITASIKIGRRKNA